MPKKLIILILCLLFANEAYADDLAQRLSLPRDARWGVVAVELQTGKELVRTGNAVAEPLTPASLVKLFTAGAALDHRERHGIPKLTTTILHDGEIRSGTLHGNIYLRGRGNALLSSGDLERAAREVAAQGIRKITGDIVADDSFFDTRGLERSRTGPGYAPAGALGTDLHTAAVTVTPTEPGKPPMVTLEPRNEAAKLAVPARTAATDLNSIEVTRLDDTAYRVSGNVAVNSGSVKRRFSLHEPALYAAGALGTRLRQVQVEVKAEGRKSGTAKDAALLTEIEGPPLERLIRDMNVNSLNVVADNLLLLLGAERFGAPGTREKGVQVISEFLGTLGLPAGEAAIADGSGLLEGNRVTARVMAEYLRKVAEKAWFTDFRDSLPRAGMDGTLKDIGYKNERFRAKGGRLEDVFALAGYGVDGKGRQLAFAFIVNVPGAGVQHLENCGAEVMRYLAAEGTK